MGVSTDVGRRLGEVELLWARPVVLLVGLGLLVPVGLAIAWRHRRGLPHISPGMRGLLTGCRLGLLLLLIVVLAGPYLRLEEPVRRKPLVAVLVDDSASMALPIGEVAAEDQAAVALAAGLVGVDDSGQPQPVDANTRKALAQLTRRQLTGRALAAHADRFDQLADRFDVRVYRFGRQTRTASFAQLQRDAERDADPPDADAEPDRHGATDTALGAAIEQVLADAADRPIAGMLVVSDGRTTAGPDPLAVVRQLQATATDERAAPVWTAPVGSGRAMADVAVLNVMAPRQVARGDTASVVATIGSQQLDNRKVMVGLFEGKTAVDRQEVLLRSADRQQVHFAYPARVAGTHQLQVRIVDAVPEEPVIANNRQALAIEVDFDRWKLLYLEGYPTWDFCFLDHALRRDRGLNVSFVVEASLRADGVAAADLPEAARLPQDAAGWAAYHAVILGDISPAMLPADYAEQLARAVREEGLGLIVRPGPQHMPHAFAHTPVGRLLAVGVAAGDGHGDDEAGVHAPAYAPFHMKVTAAGSMHPAFRLADSASEDRAIWSRMPGFYWAAALDEPSPAATVLAELESPEGRRPLIAEHTVGQGRVFVVGTDATFRWRHNIGDHLFYRFWGQAIRHVARSRDRSDQRSWLQVYPTRVESGEPVTVELFALDADGRPLVASELAVEVRRDRSDATDLLRLAYQGAAGRYRGVWPGGDVGEVAIGYTDARGRRLRSVVRVAPSGRELLHVDVDRNALGNLADASGGKLIELTQIERFIAGLQGQPQTVYRAHEASVWDNWLTLVLLVLLYGTDVFVRRMSGLT